MKHKNSIEIILALLLFCSCNGGSLFSKSSPFIGEWKLSKGLILDADSFKTVTLKISKEDIFYTVEYWATIRKENSTKDTTYEFLSMITDNPSFVEAYHRYELSADKKLLVCTGNPEYTLEYKEDENVIKSSMFGWFKKK